MNINESTSGVFPISSTTKTVSVPAGEVWKFTAVVGAGGISVGVYDGSTHYHVVFSGSNIPTVGSDGESDEQGGVRTFTVDGDTHDLSINSPNDTEVYWAATRVK